MVLFVLYVKIVKPHSAIKGYCNSLIRELTSHRICTGSLEMKRCAELFELVNLVILLYELFQVVLGNKLLQIILENVFVFMRNANITLAYLCHEDHSCSPWKKTKQNKKQLTWGQYILFTARLLELLYFSEYSFRNCIRSLELSTYPKPQYSGHYDRTMFFWLPVLPKRHCG